MNIGLQNSNRMLAGGRGLFGGGLLKSTAQKLERQADRDRQVAFFENQKKNLKNIQCSSPEEVARVLEMLHSYEDQIAAVKAEYNNAQMFHLMDEAKEQGERIAKAIEKSEPKTAEERKKEAVEEALGIDEEKGLLSDILDKVTEEALTEALEDVPEAEASLDQEPAQAAEVPAVEQAQTAQVPATETAQATQIPAAETTQAAQVPAAETAQAAQVPATETAQAAQVTAAKPEHRQPQEIPPAHSAVYKRFDAFA